MELKKLPFTGTPDDFVGLVRWSESRGHFTNPDTGLPSTREEIAATLMMIMDVNLGPYPDFKTLDLCSNGSNFAEKFEQAIEENRNNPDWALYFMSKEKSSS